MFLQISGISEHLFCRFELKFGDIESAGYPCYFIFSALGIESFDLCICLAVRDRFADSHVAVRLRRYLRGVGDAYDLPAARDLFELHGDFLRRSAAESRVYLIEYHRIESVSAGDNALYREHYARQLAARSDFCEGL